MHLSPSKISVLNMCPHQFKFQYVNHLQKRQDSASLLYGQAIHHGVEETLKRKFMGEDEAPIDPVKYFWKQWRQWKKADLEYSANEDWKSLFLKGILLMREFRNKYLGRFRKIYEIEGEMSFMLDAQTRVYGRKDVVAEFVTEEGEIINALIDIKTAKSRYSEDKIKFHDQLTAYSIDLAKQHKIAIQKIVLMVFVKTKTPYIQILTADMRTQQEMDDYIDTCRFHLNNVYSGRFPKIKGDHCSWMCNYADLCLNNKKAVVEKLMIKITKFNRDTGEHDLLHQFYPNQYNHLGEVEEDVQPMSYLRDFVKEFDIPGIGVGFTVQKDFGHRKQIFHYWWEDEKLQRIYRIAQKEAV